MKRYKLAKKDSLTAADRAASLPVAFDDLNLELLVEMMLPSAEVRSRTQLRMQLEDQMAAAIESAMRGTRASFLDLYEYVPGDLQPGGVYAVTRVAGPVLLEMEVAYCFVPVTASEIRPQPLIVRDGKTGAANEMLTPGGRADLRGFDLLFDSAREDEGVFLVDAIDGAEIRVNVLAIRAADDASEDEAGGTGDGGDVIDDGVAASSVDVGFSGAGVEASGAGTDEPSSSDGPTDPNAMQVLTLAIPTDVPSGMYHVEVRSRPGGESLKIGRLPAEVRVRS